MQKLVYRSSYANKYAARKLAKQKLLDDRKHQTKDRLELRQINERVRKHTKLLHQERWDSVYRGQLAPRYDVGAQAERWGTIDQDFSKPARVPEKKRTTCPFAVNDRVALVAAGYRDRGKIGKVLDVNEENQSVRVEGVELVSTFLQSSGDGIG